jgi:hypothetical protein
VEERDVGRWALKVAEKRELLVECKAFGVRLKNLLYGGTGGLIF